MIGVILLGQDLDTHGDESITVNSKLKNFQDLATVFTDVSTSFSLPATEKNNRIFQHYWKFNIDIVNLFNLSKIDYRIKQLCKLEKDGMPFRDGLLRLTSITMKDGKPSDYNCTWVGHTATLKDIFGEDQVADLNWLDLNHPISSSYWVSIGLGNRGGLKLFDDKVIYPLMTKAETEWTETRLAAGTPDKEFHPAVRTEEVFKRIQTKYGLTFDMPLLNEDWFKKMYMWLPNTPAEEDIDPLTSYRGTQLDMTDYNPKQPFGREIVNLDENYIRTAFMSDIGGNPDSFRFEVTFTPKAADATKEYTLRAYQATPTINGHLGFNLLDPPQNNTATGTSTYNVTIPGSLNGKLYKWYGTTTLTGEQIEYDAVIKAYITRGGVESLVTTIDLVDAKIYNIKDDITRSFPELTVIDFFTAFIKMYNLVVIPVKHNEFLIEPYDTWKANGGLVDITRWVDITEYTVYPINIPNLISFEYQDPTNAANKKFKELTKEAYGDEHLKTVGEGEEYRVEVPRFENMLWERLNPSGGTTPDNYYVGNALSDSNAPEISNVYLFFWSELKSADFIIQGVIGTSDQTIDEYKLCDSYYETTTMTHTLNFGGEINAFSTIAAPNNVNLIDQYYQIELTRLLDGNIREYQFTSIISFPVYSKIVLNDDIKIGDNYFSILEMDYNMLTSEAMFKLVNKEREVITVTPPSDTEPPSIGTLSIVGNPPGAGPNTPSLSVFNETTNSVNLYWGILSGSDPLTNVEVWQDGLKVSDVSPSNTDIMVTGLSPSTQYNFYIKLFDDNGANAQSNTVVGTTTSGITYKTVEMSPIGHLSAVDACSDGASITRYHSGANEDLSPGDIIYSDSSGSIYNGNNQFYREHSVGGGRSFKIGLTGVVGSLTICHP